MKNLIIKKYSLNDGQIKKTISFPLDIVKNIETLQLPKIGLDLKDIINATDLSNLNGKILEADDNENNLKITISIE